MSNFKDLVAWQKARFFIWQIYTLTQNFPEEEKFGLISQIRRASISIANNIVEGSARGLKVEFARFLDRAFASSVEDENLLYILSDHGFIDHIKFQEMEQRIIEIQKKIIKGLKKSIKNNKQQTDESI